MSPPPDDPRLQSLRRALERGEIEGVAAVLNPLSPEERAAFRRALLTEIQEGIKRYRTRIEEGWRVSPGRALVVGDLRELLKNPQASLRAHRLAAVGLGLKKDVDSALFSSRLAGMSWDWQVSVDQQFGYQAGLALLPRPEPWTDELLCRLIEQESAAGGDAGCLQLGLRLLREGAQPRDEILAATARQARRLGFLSYFRDRESDFPWTEPVGREVVWAALEAREEPFMASADMGGGFTERLLKETAQGRFDRARLVALSLRRLAESSRTHEANFWGRLVEKLELTGEDWAAHAEGALDLVGAPNPRAVSVGLEAVGRLLTAGGLSGEEAVPVLAIAVAAPAIGSAKSAVSLLRRCAKEDGVRVEALRAALGGLQHAKRVVADAVLSWLEKESWWRAEAEALDAVLDASLAAPAAVGVRLQTLLPEEEAGLAPAPPAPDGGDDEQAVAAEIRQRLAAEAEPKRRGWLERCLAALETGGPPPAPLTALPDFWRRDLPFSVPATAEETARLMLRVTVAPLDCREWEAVCAGIRRPVPEEDRDSIRWTLDPVLKLREGTSASPTGALFPDSWGVMELAEEWLGIRPAVDGTGGVRVRTIALPHRQLRHRAALAAIRRRDTDAPVGLPTHRSGWLAPAALAARLVARKTLPAEELFELGSALYRLAPDAHAREAAWLVLGPSIRRWGEPASLALAAALAPGREGEQAARQLVQWFERVTGGLGGLGTILRWAAGTAAAALSSDRSLPDLTQRPFLELRLVTAALRARRGLEECPELENAARRLPTDLADRLRGGGSSRSLLVCPSPCDPDRVAQSGLSYYRDYLRGHQWYSLTLLLPELAGYSHAGVMEPEEAAFAFPASVPLLAACSLAYREPEPGIPYTPAALAHLRRPDVPIRPLLPALAASIPKQADASGAVLQALLAGLADGRLHCSEVADAFGAALGQKEASVKAQVEVLRALAAGGPALREIAARAVETAVSRGIGDLNAGERLLVLESLVTWRSEAGRAVSDAAAREALEKLAGPKRGTRLSSLARQLLDLPERGGPGAASLFRAHDFRALVEGEAPERKKA